MPETVETKLYIALQDFVLPKVTQEGAPDGEVSYVKGEKYELPEAVAALAPEGSLQEVKPPQDGGSDQGDGVAPKEVPPQTPGGAAATTEAVVPPPGQEQGTPSPKEMQPQPTAPANAGWAGGHAPVGRE